MHRPTRSTDGISPSAPRRRLDDFTGSDLRRAKQIRPQSPKAQKRAVVSERAIKTGALLSNNQEFGQAFDGAKKKDNKLTRFLKRNNKTSDEHGKTKRRWFGLRGPKLTRKEKKQIRAGWPRYKRVLRRMAIVFGVLIVLLLGVILLKGWTTFSNIIDRAGAGSPLFGTNVQPNELHGEGDGRVNIALFGVADAGGADTIIITSIDTINFEATILSVPRDLLVTNPDTGGSMKINATYPSLHIEGGPALIESILQEILGINIHYYVSADFGGFEKAVDAIGGIDLVLDERIYKDYSHEYGQILNVGPGEVYLDGRQALLLGRNRDYVTGDVERNEVQRKLLLAIRDKALSPGTLSNPLKIYSIFDALGDNVRTNLQLGDMLRIKELGEEITPDKILSYGLTSESDNYLVNSSHPTYGFVFVPRSGNFNAIQNFVRSIFIDGFIKNEKAVVDVLNGTGQVGLATEKADELRSYGYYLGEVDNAPSQVETTRIYDLTNDSPFTRRYLEQRFGVTARESTSLPTGITTDADFVIILGSDEITEEEDE